MKRRLALAACAALLGLPAASAFGATLTTPASATEPPPFFELSARQAIAIADRAPAVRRERRTRRLTPRAYTRGAGRWQVSYHSRGEERAQVLVDDRLGAVLEAWTGPQVRWTMARGYEGAFGRKLNAPWVWIPLCLAFVIPFVDPRRPFRLLHLDLLVLLSFGVSHLFFNRGEIATSVPLAYPVLFYLLIRALAAGFRPRAGRGTLVPLVPAAWLALGLVFLIGFRVALNVVDSNVIDVGYAGVVGADRIADGEGLYDGGFPDDIARGDTYGPVTYLAYVPFEQGLSWSGAWDDLPAAHAAALAFDLLTLGGLFLLGRRLRPGPEGRMLGLALAYAWAAYPYTLFALASNANDSLVALLTVAGLLVLASPPARGAMVALAGAAKFASLALVPLFARGSDRESVRSTLVFVLVLVAVLVAVTAPFLPEGGFERLYDRTIGYQAGRDSPFSIWGQDPSLGWVQSALKVAAVGLALLVVVVPRRRDPVQVAALAAAVLIAVQLTVAHWFYLYIVWFAPALLVAVLAPYAREPGAPAGPSPETPAAEPVAVPA